MTSLPRFIVVEVTGSGWLKYMNEKEIVCANGDGVFDPLSKIEVERSKNEDNDYFHLRFCQTNKYWARGGDGGALVANSNKPEEDTSKPSCTLFHFVTGGFQHVQSGGHVNMNESNNRMFVADPEIDSGFVFLTILNWVVFVKMPEHVAFKGDNENFLSAYWNGSHPYLQFSSNDANVEASGYHIQSLPDGRIRLKSDYFDKFWRLDPNWIWADSSDTGFGNINTLFWPVKINENTIALRSEGNSKFCKRLTTDGKTNCLNAAVSTITKEARLEVEELVFERKVYNVKYRMDEARVYDQRPFVAGTTTVVNNTNQESTVNVEITYEESESYTFSRSVSITAGVTFTLEAGVPLIAKEGIEISLSVTGAFEWSDTKTTTKSSKASGEVPVPAKSSAKVKYVGTVGSCDIPFSYTQEDKSSTDGTITYTEKTDGLFTGVNSYNFDFQFDEIKAL